MALAPRHVAVFGSGLVIGIAGAWLAYGSHAPPAAPKASIPVAASPPKNPEAAVGLREPSTPASPDSASSTATMGAGSWQRASCSGLLVAARPGDGETRLVSDVSSKTAADAAAMILSGKEAAASGRPRDAEAAFLSACRISAKTKGEGSVEYADAKYQLGRLYANVSGSGEKMANRQELAGRAELLYADSLQTYLARYGEGHEKSKFALEGLAGLRQIATQHRTSSASAAEPEGPAGPPAKLAVAPAPAPSPGKIVPEPVKVAAAPATQPAPAPVPRAAKVENTAPASAEAPVRQARPSATEDVRPSFDCTRARSPSEKLICSDRELAQLDRNLGRLHARARSSTSDPGAFKRHNEAEWRRRESTCRGDRECLLDWYAERREQLLNDEVD